MNIDDDDDDDGGDDDVKITHTHTNNSGALFQFISGKIFIKSAGCWLAAGGGGENDE
jgi:hypothetical protein